MRIKSVVISIFVVIALLAGYVVIKALMSDDSTAPVEIVATNDPAPVTSNATHVAIAATRTNAVAITPEEEHKQYVEKQLDDIRDAIISSSTNKAFLVKVLDLLTDKDAEVRKSALEAVMHINDTNAIPRLKDAMERVEDTKEKAAIQDVIDFLALPETRDMTGAVSSVPATNMDATVPNPVQTNAVPPK